jgi:hypothetical protein
MAVHFPDAKLDRHHSPEIAGGWPLRATKVAEGLFQMFKHRSTALDVLLGTESWSGINPVEQSGCGI